MEGKQLQLFGCAGRAEEGKGAQLLSCKHRAGTSALRDPAGAEHSQNGESLVTKNLLMLLSAGGRAPWIGIQNATNCHGAPLPTHTPTPSPHTPDSPRGHAGAPPPTCEPPMRPSSTSRAPAITSHGPSARFPLMEARPGRAGRAALPWQPRDSGLGPGQRPPTKWRRGAQNGAGLAGLRRGGGGGGARG